VSSGGTAHAVTGFEVAPGIQPLAWLGDRVRMLDQTALPLEERYVECSTPEEIAVSIRRLEVRGAPLLGIAAAYGMALGAMGSGGATGDEVCDDLRDAGGLLVGSRPTAVNIRWAVERVMASALSAAGGGATAVRSAAVAEAGHIAAEDEASCRAIGHFGAELVPQGANVLTHCNTGALATGGIGTALGVIQVAHEQGKRVHAWVDETRPVWQGARLTAWELRKLGIPMTLVADTAPGSLMARGAIDMVVVGADRIAANGDVANKIGTYQLAVLARHHQLPFYVAAPISTVDLATSTGEDIVIERRDPEEVSQPFGLRIAPEGTWAVNPAFDVTPAKLVTGIITDRGVVRPPFRAALRRLAGGAR
jgi:methylthioribose-1-phosphate isomerase